MSLSQDFVMFQELTGSASQDNRTAIVNEAVSRSHGFPELMTGRTEATTFRGGKTIRENIQFDNKATAQNVRAMQTRNYQHRQAMTTIEIRFRRTEDYMVWEDSEVALNEGEVITRAMRDVQFKNLQFAFEQRLWTSVFEYLDDVLFRVPVGSYGATAMEANNGLDQYSIFSCINGETNGLYSGAGWTTFEGINPSTESLWRPQRRVYDDSQLLTDTVSSMIRAFDDMARDVHFVPPQMEAQYFEGWNPNRQVIFASRDGVNTYSQALRSLKDNFAVSRQDPAFMDPRYNGIKVKYISRMDTATAWDGGTTNEADASVTGPRFLWANGDYTMPIFHRDYYFKKDTPMRHINQPDTWVQRVEIWWNLMFKSRQRQGIIYPSASTTNTTPA